MKTGTEFSLNPEEKRFLLEIARESIRDHLTGKAVRQYTRSDLSPALSEHAGAFVSLHKGKKLRGCIGRFGSEDPLFQLVQKIAVSSACNDYRFKPVIQDELDKIEIEISVLSPLTRIDTIQDFIPGKHGIYIKKAGRTGTFLPQVGLTTGWSREEMLGHCAMDKAGLGWDGWKDAELFIYTAMVFSEQDFSR